MEIKIEGEFETYSSFKLTTFKEKLNFKTTKLNIINDIKYNNMKQTINMKIIENNNSLKN